MGNHKAISQVVQPALNPAYKYPYFLSPLKVPALKPAVVCNLLSVVNEGVVGVDKKDVLGLQVSVSQLVVMENCSGDSGGGGERMESRLRFIRREPTPSSGRVFCGFNS